jgi:phage terminase large subunit
MGSTILNTWRKHVIKEALANRDIRFYGGSAEKAAQYEYTNGSVIVIGGLDVATRVLSAEYDVIYVNEATEIDENDWETLTGRLRNGVVSFQQLIGDCNPDKPTHWLKRRCDTGKTMLLNSKHEENPVYFDSDGVLTDAGRSYIERLDSLTGHRHARYRLGIWAAAEGLVYQEFDDSVNVLDRFEIPKDWTRWWSIDFGYTNPFVCQMWAEDPDGRLYLYREFYQSQRLVEDHAKDILSMVTDADGNWAEPQPTRVICDHDAEDRATLERHLGLSTSAAHKSVSDGIQAVGARLRVAGDGKPRLMFLRDSLVQQDQALVEAGKPWHTVGELTGYVWDRAQGKAPKEAPVKKDDHGCDAMRYVVAEQDLATRFRLSFL